MKIFLAIFLFTFFSCHAGAQEVPATTEEQLENLADIQQGETEDDSYLQALDHFKKHPININSADANELRELIVLSDLQIDNLVSYRNLLGKFVSIYELQSVPTWNIATIKKILPYIIVGNASPAIETFRDRLKKGDQRVLLRFSEILERSEGFDHSIPGTKYLGGREKLFFRYRYQFKNLLQFGIAGDRDAGEPFFKGAGKYGFDFYSFHLFARKIGKVQALALGDFTVNMGQGLIQWQSLAFSKSADVMDVKRQSGILRPYSSSGEFYFQRGAGITMQFGKAEATLFGSVRKLSSNFVVDTLHTADFISSFQNSGYHRTQSEIDDRNDLRQLSWGGNFTYRKNDWHIGINGVAYNFSLPIIKRPEPYNLFAIGGKSWGNYSVDYSYTHRNIHLFGEEAADGNFDKAIINGLLVSVDPAVDLSLVQRAIDKKYQAVYGDAFTENSYPTNENGIYAGASIRPWFGWKVDMYADLYRFPWLKYLVDAPSFGKEYLVQITFTPNKQLEIYSRFRTETKQIDAPGNASITNFLVSIPKQSWRTEINYHINTSITLRERIELLWYDEKGADPENGFLNFFDIIYKPLLKPYSGNLRLEYFETGGYNSRVYAYENDVLYNFSIPASFGKGYRYYINLNYDLGKNLSIWLRLAETIYKDDTIIGSDLDKIPGNHRTEIKLQVQKSF